MVDEVINGDLVVRGNITVRGANHRLISDGDLSVEGFMQCKCCGRAKLVNGAVTVATEMITERSFVMLTYESRGGNPGHIQCDSRVPGTSFTVSSSNANDDGTFVWMLLEHAL